MSKKVISVRWFRVATALAMASALSAAALMLPDIGRLGTGVLLLVITSAAVRLAWTASRSMTDVIADVDAEPLVARAPRRP